MNALQSAQAGYESPNGFAKSPRAIEYQIFKDITSDLEAASVKGDQDHPGLVRALFRNKKLWLRFAANTADEENQLPQDLRVGLLNLASFVMRHSSEVLAGRAEASALVEINAAVMAGLSNNTAAQ